MECSCSLNILCFYIPYYMYQFANGVGTGCSSPFVINLVAESVVVVLLARAMISATHHPLLEVVDTGVSNWAGRVMVWTCCETNCRPYWAIGATKATRHLFLQNQLTCFWEIRLSQTISSHSIP